ncbi:hypothetical protein EON79_12625 [bacterium]|nr:MAG: hypothetical protein EON79_12625 [bacterium]
MRSIQSTTRRAFDQALACAAYRVPSADKTPTEVWLAASALRYGLFGCAAAHALLIGAGSDDEVWILDHLGEIGDTVAEHYMSHVMSRAPVGIDLTSAWRVGEMAQLVADDYAPLGRRMTGVNVALRLASESFGQTRDRAIFASLPWWRRKDARRRYEALVDESLALAEKFYERRILDLDEVREIALLGE